MFNVSPFASLTEVNRMLSAWGYRATAYEPARGGVENQCLIIDTPAASAARRVVLRLHRPGSGARVRLELAALEHLAARGPARAAAAADGRGRDARRIPGRAGVSPFVRGRRVAGSLRARARVRTQHRRAARAHRPRARRLCREAATPSRTTSPTSPRRAIGSPPAARSPASPGSASRTRWKTPPAPSALAGAAAPGDPRRRLAQQHHL